MTPDRGTLQPLAMDGKANPPSFMARGGARAPRSIPQPTRYRPWFAFYGSHRECGNGLDAPEVMKTLAIFLALTAAAPAQKLIGWNNLGMHCMDDDYSVFSILPPYNTVDAQLINASGKLVRDTTGITVTYEAIADPDGSINQSSVGKSTFWDHSQALFGVALPPETGLTGKKMPGPHNEPQFLDFNGVMNWFEGLGIPITPIDDAGHANPYPLMRLTAKTAAGSILASTDVVLPVSGEMDCRKCHGSNTGPAAQPAAGWVNNPQISRDYRLNILRLHDEKHLGETVYTNALAATGYTADGLYSSVVDHQKPVLCAACHASEALGTGGAAGVGPLTRAMHSLHANVVAPDSGLTLDHVTNRSSCYQCHPGSATRCLRGAMGSAVAADGSAAMQCQSCHGTMSQVGASTRTGWLDEPNCQQCHTGSATQNNGQIRYTSVFESNGTPRVPVSSLFATNPDTPAAGKSLYRFSKGHGGLQCGACHGSTHAEFPALHRNDNLQSIKMQGHVGVVADCTACHTTVPNTVTGGPHGMHPVGSGWISAHKDNGKSSSCLACHGSDRRGTVLSRAFADRTLTFSDDGVSRSVTLFRGENVSCFICHKREDNGGLGGVFTNNSRPVVASTTLVTASNTPGAVTLNSSDANGNPRTLRIVKQANHGSVSLAGKLATYVPEQDFAGPDSFTFAAFDGFADSNLGVVSVTVGNPAATDTLDRDNDQFPDLVEYALGLSTDFPTSPAARIPFLTKIGGTNYLTLAIPRSQAPSDATVIIEYSSDLERWVPGTILTNSPFLLEARDPDPAIGHAERFVRIRAKR